MAKGKTGVLATLALNLTANSKGLYKGLRNSRRRTDTWANQMRRQIKTVSKAFAGIALAVAVAFSAMYAEQAKAIDQLGKTSDKLGIATQELAGLRLAAELTGVSQNNLDMGLQRMTRRLSEAAAGTGEAKNAIKELGLDAQTLAKLSPDKAFREISVAMNQIPNQADRVRLAFKLFDTEGVNLVNTLRLGKNGLAGAADEAEIFGLALTRIDVAKVEQANDQFTRIRAIGRGLAQQLTVQAAPAVGLLAEKFVGVAKEAGGMGNIAQMVITKIAGGVGMIGDFFNGLNAVWQGLKVGFVGFGTLVVTVIEGMFDGLSAFTQSFAERMLSPIRFALEFAAQYSDTAKEQLALIDGFVDKIGFEAPEAVRNAAAFMRDQLDSVKGSFNEVAMGPYPSDTIAQFFDEVKLISSESAEELIKNSPVSILNIDEAKQEVILENQKTLNDKLRAEQQKHFNKYGNVVKLFNDWEVKTTAQKAGAIIQITKGLAGPLVNESKKMFNLMKIARIGEAIMNTYAGINQAMASLPYPFNIAAATVVGAMGFANVAAIKKQKFRSAGSAVSVVPIGSGIGGGSAFGGGGASIPTIEDQREAIGEEEKSATVVNNINIGEVHGNDGRRVFEEIREYVRQGQTLIESGTRQAEVLAEDAA
ncbi:hypothetical protein FLL45_01565 [Aliikangiella marina]|uniref:Bacteriophage tail tape measure N-terminal domain-containing protein n=1 Tax=Aliikangiella marina TaxID=1712262 RepID=A0A545THI9_9GAMM|nr:hypothetical protein [Aliikangiella marina]TQV76675.1 hypothetical protein FLL45_01565 [Aliikangiella marina]